MAVPEEAKTARNRFAMLYMHRTGKACQPKQIWQGSQYDVSKEVLVALPENAKTARKCLL